jgi:FkbM family methyltransferase
MGDQYGESAQIAAFFNGHIGRFLDIGAFDGVMLSNTAPLRAAGWHGVLIEPSPAAFTLLQTNCPGMDLVNAPLVPNDIGSGLRLFQENASAGGVDMLSTLSAEHKAKLPKYPWRPMWTVGVTWGALLRQFPGPYDFVNLDVEGLNAEVLAAAPFYDVGARLWCVEMAPPERHQEIRDTLAGAGYASQITCGGNLLAWRD